MIPPTAVDFETEPIQARPDYPPKPVSVAIWEPGKKPEFWAWGHPDGGNCTKARVARRLREVWRNSNGVLFHEAAFDLDVAEVHFGLTLPPWHRVHDTIYLLFLADPNAEALGLKPAAKRYLGRSEGDQEPLRRWILKHVPEARRRPTQWEAHLCRLPWKKAATRAIGDVRRTMALWRQFYAPSEAYDRERRLLPARLAMERRGVPVDVAGLARDAERGEAMLARVDRWLRQRLATPNLNVDSRPQLADALEEARLVDEWFMTAPSKTHPEGSRMTGVEALREVCKARDVVDVLAYRGKLRTQVRTFAKPWLAQAQRSASAGRIYVRFNQVRSASPGPRKQVGARTGRLSSSPNLQNVPVLAPKLVRTERAIERFAKRQEVLWVPIRGTALLDMRARVRAPQGYLLGDHDYSQQELRILAHFAKGPLAGAYCENPYQDAHAFVHGWVVEALHGMAIERRNVKAVNFGVLYGEGLDLLSHKLGIERDAASVLRRLCKDALGSDRLDLQLKRQGYAVTIGGRHCPVEPPKLVNGELRTWEYKLLNTLIQGSAGDQIKEAMIAIHERYPDLLRLSVHDEVVWEAPAKQARGLVKPIARIMETCMPLSVPMVAAGAVGRTWRECH